MKEQERSAWICNHKAHGELPQRVFLLPGDRTPPRCSDGHVMTRQVNLPYNAGKRKKAK